MSTAPKPTLDERRDKWINKHYDWQGTSSDDNFKRLLREGWDACAKEKDAEIELIHSRYKTGRALLQIEMLEKENEELRSLLEKLEEHTSFINDRLDFYEYKNAKEFTAFAEEVETYIKKGAQCKEK